MREESVDTIHVSRKLLFNHLYWNSQITEHVSKNDWAPVVIVPLLASVLLALSIFLLIVFRQNPAFVISTVAGCLIFITIYLTLSAIQSTKVTYA